MNERLAAMVDGAPLEDEAARALWQRFSAYMEEHRGDFAGFAAREGYARAEVGLVEGRPTLTLSHQAAPDKPAKKGRKPWPKRKRTDRRRRKPRK